MELAKEIMDSGVEWPEQALTAMRDADGEIKFSTKSKGFITLVGRGIYMRGDDCLINNRMIEEPPVIRGTVGRPDILTKVQFENFYYATK